MILLCNVKHKLKVRPRWHCCIVAFLHCCIVAPRTIPQTGCTAFVLKYIPYIYNACVCMCEFVYAHNMVRENRWKPCWRNMIAIYALSWVMYVCMHVCICLCECDRRMNTVLQEWNGITCAGLPAARVGSERGKRKEEPRDALDWEGQGDYLHVHIYIHTTSVCVHELRDIHITTLCIMLPFSPMLYYFLHTQNHTHKQITNEVAVRQRKVREQREKIDQLVEEFRYLLLARIKLLYIHTHTHIHTYIHKIAHFVTVGLLHLHDGPYLLT